MSGLDALDPVIHQPVRLQLMALLYRNRSAAAVWVRDSLGLTDGNFASHAARLVEAGYIEQRRAISPGGFQVRLTITAAGDAAYARYREALRAVVEGEPLPPPSAGETPARRGDPTRAEPDSRSA